MSCKSEVEVDLLSASIVCDLVFHSDYYIQHVGHRIRRASDEADQSEVDADGGLAAVSEVFESRVKRCWPSGHYDVLAHQCTNMS